MENKENIEELHNKLNIFTQQLFEESDRKIAIACMNRVFLNSILSQCETKEELLMVYASFKGYEGELILSFMDELKD